MRRGRISPERYVPRGGSNARRKATLAGARGLRLDPAHNSREGTTEPPEYEANYWSVVALEPEVLATVIGEGGREPERLILVRKGRGTTRHKGGTLMQPSDDLDTCLVEWLKANIAVDRCFAASRLGVAPDVAPLLP